MGNPEVAGRCSGARDALHGAVDAVEDAHDEARRGHIVAQVVVGVGRQSEIAVEQGDEGESARVGREENLLGGGGRQ